MSELQKKLKHAVMHVGAGGSAGFIEVCIMHPLDLVKTRLQLQKKFQKNTSSSKYYTGIFDCAKKMYKTEGPTSFWKGVIPPILAETPKRACKFATFEQYKRLFTNPMLATPITYSLAGGCAGVTEAILVNPFEVVKIQLQANSGSSKELPSTWAMTKIVTRNGYIGLYRGLDATMGRNLIFNSIYFGFYFSVKDYVPEFEDPLQEFLRKVAIGFTSGILGSLANLPFDVVKSRLQGPQTEDSRKYKNCFHALASIYKEEGFKALYKGLLPKLMRLGPGGAIMLIAYENVYNFLQKKFPD